MDIGAGAHILNPTRDDPFEAGLVERCRRNDLDAFSMIVDAYQARLFGFLRRMVDDREEAADLVQEVFVRAYQNFPSFDGRCSVRTWLFRIAHNLCVDRSRRLSRRISEVSLMDFDADKETANLPDRHASPEQATLDAELVEVVEAAIRTMSDKLASVLLLHDKEDLSYEEIGQVLGLRLGTVKSRLFLARAHIGEAVRRYREMGVLDEA